MNEAVASVGTEQITVIRPRRGWWDLGFSELWEFRELIWVFALRDIKVRYKQTFFGLAWTVLQPLSTMIVFTVFFGGLAGLGAKTEVHYSVFSFAGLILFGYFSSALGGAAGSIVDHKGIITKVYFPRLILPLFPLVSGLVDLGITLVILLGLMGWFGIAPSVNVVFLPVFLVLTMVTALSIGLWVSALNAHYRDFRYTIPFLLQIWLFLCPIVYPVNLIESKWRLLYGMNPMASVIEGFRWSLLGKGDPPGSMLLVSSAVVILLLLGGLFFFRQMERTFVDVV